ncbi:MAG: hypothetical protein ACUVRP_12350 [Chlorobiales bacterium]
MTPELEVWLIEIAIGISILPEDFSLPSSPNKLGRLIKDEGVEKNQGDQRFIRKLIDANPPQVQTLCAWIEEVQSVERP